MAVFKKSPKHEKGPKSQENQRKFPQELLKISPIKELAPKSKSKKIPRNPMKKLTKIFYRRWSKRNKAEQRANQGLAEKIQRVK